jgi:hypothetical protein
MAAVRSLHVPSSRSAVYRTMSFCPQQLGKSCLPASTQFLIEHGARRIISPGCWVSISLQVHTAQIRTPRPGRNNSFLISEAPGLVVHLEAPDLVLSPVRKGCSQSWGFMQEMLSNDLQEVRDQEDKLFNPRDQPPATPFYLL